MLSRQLEKGQYNTVFSIKQCAGPVGMALSGLVIPFLTVRYGWRVGLSFCRCIVRRNRYLEHSDSQESGCQLSVQR